MVVAIATLLQTACNVAPQLGDELGVNEQAASIAGTYCSAPQLTVSVDGSVATLTASASCRSTPEYRFLVQAPGEPAYTEVAPYSTAATTTFDVTSLGQSGRYSAMVQVREAGATLRDAYAYDAFLVGNVCTGATLNASPAANGRVELSASARCPAEAGAEYRLLVRAPGASAYTELRGYDQSATFSWDVSNLAVAGRYDLLVYARAAGNLSSYEAYASAGAVVGGVCTAATLTAAPNGTTTNLEAGATCGGSAAEYRFLARAPGATGYSELRGWGAATYAWNTSNVSVAGRYDLLVYARRAGNQSAYEAYASANTMVGSVCTAATLGVTANGSTKSLVASATCSGAAAEYRFVVRAPGATAFTELRGWGESSYAWDTSGLSVAGRYDLLVYARAVGNSSTYEAYASGGVNVGEVCTSAALTATAGSGSTVNLAATATCSTATPEFRYYVRGPGAASYEELRAWGSPDLAWDFSGLPAGTYSFLVYARVAGHGSAYEAYATKVVVVSP